MPRRLFTTSDSGDSDNYSQMAAPFGATFDVGGPAQQGGSQVCNACGYAMPSSKSITRRPIGPACKQCGYVDFPNETQSQNPVPLQEPQMVRPRTNVFAPLFQPTHHSSLIAQPKSSVQQDGRGFEMSHMSSIEVPNGQPQPNEKCMGATYSIPSSRDDPTSVQQDVRGLEMSYVSSIGVPNGQCKPHGNCMGATYSIPSSRVETMSRVAPQICTACGHAVPSVRNISCKQCGYEVLLNVPQPQRPVPLQQPQMVGNTRAPLHQVPPLPSTNVTAPNFQPITHTTPRAKPGLPAQQVGRCPEMPPVSSVGVPRGQSAPPENCLRCCFQPYPQGQQGGPWPPQSMYSGDPCRWQPEVCQRCCSAKVPDRAVVTNVSPLTSVSYRPVDSLEPATFAGSAGRGGGGRRGGNEFFLLDESSGRAERWNLQPSATYSFIPPQANSFRLHPAAHGMTQRSPDNSAVYVRLPHPSALSASDATGPQLVRQAAMLGLSQRRDSSPALFVRLGPNGSSVAPQSSPPRTAREFQPPGTPLGKSAFRTLQDMDDSKRELQRQSAELYDRCREHLTRMEGMRQLPRYAEFGDSRRNRPPDATFAIGPRQPPATPAVVVRRSSAPNMNSPGAASPWPAAPGRPLPASEKSGSVSVSTQTTEQSSTPASPAPARDSQDQR